MTDIKAVLAASDHDLRFDLALGLANWFIFLDHIPDNVVNWVTLRNYGFSGAADVFVFAIGYTAAIRYARMMLERGVIVGATRLFGRVWRLYVAYVVFFVIYIVTVGSAAARYAASDLIYEFNLAGLVDHPILTLRYGLLLLSTLPNLDMLQLSIVLMAALPPVLWLMLRAPTPVLAGSAALYVAARHFEWSLPSFPDGSWTFNPLCWQLLFVLGAWSALGGAGTLRRIRGSPVLFYAGAAYLAFALVMTMAGRFPEFGNRFPEWLVAMFNPNDKTNLAPYRLLHFIVIALFVARFVSRDWPVLQWLVAKPLIICDQQSLAVFCVGVFLSFVVHFRLTTSSASLIEQIVLSAAGIIIMTLVASYLTWSSRQDAGAGASPS